MRERELLAEVSNLLVNLPRDRRIAPGSDDPSEPGRDPAKSPSFHRVEVIPDRLIVDRNGEESSSSCCHSPEIESC